MQHLQKQGGRHAGIPDQETHLESTPAKNFASVDSKRLMNLLTSLNATLTKTRGEGVIMTNQPHSPKHWNWGVDTLPGLGLLSTFNCRLSTVSFFKTAVAD